VPDEVAEGEEDDDGFVGLEHEVCELVADVIGSVSPEEVVLVDPVEEEEGDDEDDGGLGDQKAVEVDGVGEDHEEGVHLVEVVLRQLEFLVEFDLEGVYWLIFIRSAEAEAVDEKIRIDGSYYY
jgi:hypothetical protein